MRKRRKENGIALLISIFVLLLISVVAIAMIVASSTETSLAGNYRFSTNVYYAALAGLEEARGRLSKNNPDYVVNADAQFLSPPGTPLNVGDRRYILNPNPDPALNENMGNMLTLYPDNEYATEFPPPNSTRTIASVSPNNAQGIPGPPFKWVRINAVSEQWLRQGQGQDVAPFDGTVDPTPLFYDGTNLNDTNTGMQVLEITALAALPNGSQKLLQYLVAPVPISLPPFFAALSLLGSSLNSSVSYTSPAPNSNFRVTGIDQDCSGSPTTQKFISIGVLVNTDYGPVVNGGNGGFGIQPVSVQATNYTGNGSNPDVVNMLSFPSNYRSPSGLDAIAQAIIQNADGVIPSGSANTQRTYLSALVSSSAMSPTSPMTLVANGDLDLTGWHNTGYGLLLVTGTLTYDPDASWRGIVLIIGQGALLNSKRGSGEIDGAVIVAKTRDSSGNLIVGSYLGASTVNYNFGSDPPSPTSNLGGNGIYYSNCWIQKARPTAGNIILSFREISQ
jgi:hypothetical protein